MFVNKLMFKPIVHTDMSFIHTG